ncbi:MAG: phage tail protein [Myxococcales bacterium]|nr:phage tail protein [Myxococcales bacterium]MCB9550336.1 phage tail protein [Myxococcales bacterium]
MSETIGEMILPGTYIEVRAEGLIGVGGIATGNVGVVGTANRGPIDEVVVLGSYDEAVTTFGAYDRWSDTGTPLTLTRLCEQLFAGGASTVYAVRVANLAVDVEMASTQWTLRAAGGAALATLTATSPGTWANTITTRLVASTRPGSPPFSGPPFTLELVAGRRKESFTGADAAALVAAVNASSQLVTAALVGNGATEPDTIAVTTQGGPDGAPETSSEVGGGLARLVREPVNLVTCALDAATGSAVILAHLEATENEGRERIAVLGVSDDATSTIIDVDRAAGSGPRLVMVAPGIVADDAARRGEANTRVDLPAPYAAALVTGKLAALAPHVSPTNKTVPAAGVTTDYSRAEQKRLLQNRMLVLHKHLGIRILQGLTTDDGAFRQISVRRIVDYAKAGVRIGSNPYIGRLNNARVRAALKATLDGFLSQMVLDEMLTGYTLDVSATRAQEIAGVALVTMTLQPTFSIDFVKVIMNLE